MDISSAFYRELVYYPVAAYTAGPVRRHLKNLLASQYDSPEDMHSRQLSRLRELIDQSRSDVPFYRDL